jgi:regulator of PEP synthase PpsR (kinase-PPPase family)
VRTKDNIDAVIKRVLRAKTSDFVQLVTIAGLDPKSDLRFSNLANLDLSGADLRGFDFTGANLSGVRFDNALISHAKFQYAVVDTEALRRAADFRTEIIHNYKPEAGYFHLHLISDATGETLITVARAAAAQYAKILPVEHVHPLMRTQKQLDRVLLEIEEAPGIVLYTLLEDSLIDRLTGKCRELGLPCLSILGPVLHLFQVYLGAESTYKISAGHTLNAEYFRRIDALNFAMMHDDGQQMDDLDEADVVLIGGAQTQKTAISIYLANRGVKVANVPFVLGKPLPHQVERLKRPLIVGLFATPERIVQIRQNKSLKSKARAGDNQHVDRQAVEEEVAAARRLYARHNWPLIDVTRRTVEESAATVLSLRERLKHHR